MDAASARFWIPAFAGMTTMRTTIEWRKIHNLSVDEGLFVVRIE